jgi:hypothetical protein
MAWWNCTRMHVVLPQWWGDEATCHCQMGMHNMRSTRSLSHVLASCSHVGNIDKSRLTKATDLWMIKGGFSINRLFLIPTNNIVLYRKNK